MGGLIYKTRGNTPPQGKQRVYFSCHCEDRQKYFDLISDDIIAKQNCAIWYLEDPERDRDDDLLDVLLSMQLFVVPVTEKLLTTKNSAMDIEFGFAMEHHIPVLPIMMEKGLEALFNQRCGDIQFLDRFETDATALGYEAKLERFLSAVLIGDSLANLVRAAFDAYVFLSYRKKDRNHAQELMRLIHKNDFCRDIAIWYDEFLSPGEDFNDLIKDALKKSDLFVLAVTPNLVNEENYVMNTEYPMAKDESKPILPVELVPTDKQLLADKYKDIPKCANAHNEAELSEALLETLKQLSIRENDGSAEHNFFIGLAYLGGIDVEVDYTRALQLISGAAKAGLPEAMERLVIMYTDAVGVARNRDEAIRWSRELAAYHFEQVFNKHGDDIDSVAFHALFQNYANKYWKETIRHFMVLADREATPTANGQLFNLLTNLGIRDYSVLFEACFDMSAHKQEFLRVLLEDLLQKTLHGDFKPYAQLFCWPCIYDLYREVLLTAEALLNKGGLTELQKQVLVTLVRDLCVINGHYDINAVVERQSVETVLHVVENGDPASYRNALNILFYLPHRKESLYPLVERAPIYPQVFSLAYLLGLQTGFTKDTAFCDELQLWDQVDSEVPMGLLAVRCNAGSSAMRGLLANAGLVTGLVFYEKNPFEWGFYGLPYSFHNLRFLSVPVGTAFLQKNCFSSMEFSRTRLTLCLPRLVKRIDESHGLSRSSLLSINILSTNLQALEEKAFLGCVRLERVTLPPNLKKIGDLTFAHCASLAHVHIPDSVEQIAQGAFYDCEALEHIALPQSLKKLGFCEASVPSNVLGAFQACRSIRSIDIPNGATHIGVYSFKECCALETVIIPDSVESISMCAFWNCTGLKQVTLPQRIDTLSICMFLGCSSLESIVIPNSVQRIGDNAFDRCTSLKNVTLPKTLAWVGQRAFAECSSLKELQLPDTLNTVRNCAFENCSSLERVGSLASVTEIGVGAFKNCGKLREFTVPVGLREIAWAAFQGCVSLTSLRVPETINRIGKSAFEGCVGLKEVLIEGKQTRIDDNAFQDCTCKIIGGIAKEPVIIADAEQGAIIDQRYKHYTWLEQVTLPEDVTHIGRYAFDGCTELKRVKLSPALRQIADGAFNDCLSLAQVQFPETLETIGEDAFKGCKSISDIQLPGSLQHLGNGAFAGCPQLKQITLPDGVLRLGSMETKNPFINGLFMNCENLNRVEMSDRVFDLGAGTFYGTALETFTIPEQVTSIRGFLFFSCTSLRSVTWNQNISVIYGRAFEGCVSLEDVQLPESLTQIGDLAFKNCRSLKELHIPNRVVFVGQSAFEGCEGIKRAVLPNALKTITQRAFCGCSSLEEVVLGEGLSAIENYAFAGCSKLKKIDLPAGVTAIGYSGFVGCDALETVIVPASVKKIEAETFGGCVSLSEIWLPEGLEEIGQHAFAGCISLKELTIPSTVKFVDSGAFVGCSPDRVCVAYSLASRMVDILGEPKKTEELQDRMILFY